MAYVKSMSIFVVAPKGHADKKDLLWDGEGEPERDMHMWPNAEAAWAELQTIDEHEHLTVFEVQMSVVGTIEKKLQ